MWAPIDLLVFLASYGLAILTKFGYPVPPSNLESIVIVLPWAAVIFLFLMYYLDAYATYTRSFEDIAWATAISIAGSSLAALVFSFWLRAFAFPRSVVLFALIYETIFFFLVTFIKVRLIPEEPFSSVFVEGVSENVAALLSSRKADSVKEAQAVAVGGEQIVEKLKEAIRYGKPVIVDPTIEQMALLNGLMVSFDDHPFVLVHSWVYDRVQVVMKRVFDIILGLLGSIIVILLLPFIGLAIYINSPGPIFFTQKRLGKGGKPFRVIKFRTMIPDAEKYTGPVLASEDDPRITRVGKFLRKTRLDELPQFFNVIIGDMSIVGPRPERPEFYEKAENEIEDFRLRLIVKPGLTGYAQVYASYSVDFRDKFFFDLFYITSPNVISTDIKVLLLTVKSVLKREGT
ncbi:sugar transferase [Coprothermobacter platensis]|uniref:sugar transferase n=1 Tax=Coprothermobacter platensis TaxID=108819 RepID=UPI000370D60A|nr:sugar transferase [Coprothermobacter platensis]